IIPTATVIAWGEDVYGPWSLQVFDRGKSGQNGVLIDWQLAFWGETTSNFKRSLRNYSDAEKYLDVYFPSRLKFEYSEEQLPTFSKIFGAVGLILFTILLALWIFKLRKKRLTAFLWMTRTPAVTTQLLPPQLLKAPKRRDKAPHNTPWDVLIQKIMQEKIYSLPRYTFPQSPPEVLPVPPLVRHSEGISL
ncbi:hypothetical protein ROZALSC1DRAFT_25977, partial [Rozella allomycis CSF55]